MTAVPLTLGQVAPDFTLPRDGGALVTLSALRPAPVVLFSYGGDGTPTCTNEVMEFNGLHNDFQAVGATVLGLSKDSVASHDRFRAKMAITLALLSDHRGHMMEDCVPSVKSCSLAGWCRVCCARLSWSTARVASQRSGRSTG